MTLDAAANSGLQVAAASTKETESIFAQLGSLVKWGVVGAGIYFGYKLFKKPGNG